MKKKISIVLVMVLAAVSLFAVPNNRNAAATVNLIRNTVITNADLNSQMQMLGASEEQALDVLDIMINDEVFLQGAERDGVTVTDAQVDALYAQQKNAYEQQAGATMTDEQFEQIVNQAYGSVDAYKETIKNQYILQTYLMQEKGEELNNGNYAPAASDVETFYKRNATSFTQAENVKFAQIYMAKTGEADQDAQKLATMQRVASDIKSGKLTFEAAVNQYTEDEESKADGGVMGWLSSDNNVVRQLWGDDFVDTVLSLPLGATRNRRQDPARCRLYCQGLHLGVSCTGQHAECNEPGSQRHGRDSQKRGQDQGHLQQLIWETGILQNMRPGRSRSRRYTLWTSMTGLMTRTST